MDIERQVATAWVLYAEGKSDDALNSHARGRRCRQTEKPVTPGVPKPARELYGVMLLESGHAGDALVAFEATSRRSPTGSAPVRTAKAAEKSGKSSKAHEYYSKVVAIADAADNTRTEVTDAHAFLTKRWWHAAIAPEHA